MTPDLTIHNELPCLNLYSRYATKNQRAASSSKAPRASACVGFLLATFTLSYAHHTNVPTKKNYDALSCEWIFKPAIYIPSLPQMRLLRMTIKTDHSGTFKRFFALLSPNSRAARLEQQRRIHVDFDIVLPLELLPADARKEIGNYVVFRHARRVAQQCAVCQSKGTLVDTLPCSATSTLPSNILKA